jgi:AhpD family alkylhydroperoxidase
MKTLITAVTLAALACGTAMAQDAPKFFKDTYPGYALGPAMGLKGALEGDQAAIDGKTMQLVQIGVAAQIPCAYCVYAHTRMARAAGATDEEIKASRCRGSRCPDVEDRAERHGLRHAGLHG